MTFKLDDYTNSQNWRFYIGSDNYDSITGESHSVYLGRAGNDTFISGADASTQIFIGGQGSDTYRISQPGSVIIRDGDDQSTDQIEATGMGFSLTSTYSLTIDDYKHLVVYDTVSDQEIWLIDWQNGDFDNAKITLKDGEYSASFIKDNVFTAPNYLGDLSWPEVFDAGLTTISDPVGTIQEILTWTETASIQNSALQDWIHTQYASNGDLRLVFEDYASPLNGLGGRLKTTPLRLKNCKYLNPTPRYPRFVI